MYENEKFLIPAGPFTLEDFYEFCYHWGLICKNKWQPDAANPSYEEEWELSGENFSLNYVDDEIAKFRFVVVNGDDEEGIVDDFVMSFPIVGKADMLATAQSAATSNDHVTIFFECPLHLKNSTRPLLKHLVITWDPANTVLVPQAALEGMARASWAQSKALISRLATSDSDPEVRTQANDILARWPS